MKKIIKFRLGFFVSLFTFLIFTSSCEKDLYEDGLQSSSRTITIKHISMSDLDKTISSRINEKIALVKKMNKSDTTIENKFEYDSSLEMYIDTENGRLIDNNGELSYTFPMFRDSEEHLENIIFKPISNGEIETYVSKYNVKPEEFVDLTYQEIATLEPQLQKMSANGWYIVCVESQTQTGVTPIDNGDLTGNFGYEPVWETTGTTCYFIDNSGSSPTDFPIITSNGTTGNNGGGTSSTGVSTSPTGISPEQLLMKNFVKNLTDEQEDWYVEQPQEFQDEIYQYLITNDFSDESKEEIKDMIDIMDDGMIDGEPVLVSPEVPIDDMEEYLDCFDTSLGATITIYADQPKTGTHSLTGPDRVGHVFISIQQGDNIASFGFYPQCAPCSLAPNLATLNPFDFISVDGVFGNDQGHDYDVSLSIPISSTGLASLINGVISVAESDPMYNIGQLNCTDVAILILEGNTSVDMPSCESPRPYWDGQTPGTLGEVIRNLPLPSEATKNTTGGTAPNNNCN